MSSSQASANIAKSVIFVLGFCLFLFLLYWLWQRQPKTELQKKVENKIETIQSAVGQNDESNMSPVPYSVLSSKDTKISGKVNPDSYVFIYSNSDERFAKSNPQGAFETGFELENGLNLLQIIVFDKDLKEVGNQSIAYYLKTEKEKLDDKNTVYIGPVKTIFDTLLSVNAVGGEKKVQTKKSTEFVFPDDEEEKSATASALASVRIGDYAIAIGTTDKEKLLNAQKLIVIRENKPQINKNISAAKIVKEPKSNIFSVTNLNDNKLAEFTITKNSDLFKDEQDATVKDILKDKKAVIIFEKSGDKNTVTSVYLLP